MNRKARLVSIFERLLVQLEAGPYQPPGDGWRDPRIVRNCELIIAAGFAMKNLPLAAVAVELLAQRQPDTVRGIMYAAVSVGWLPDTSDKSYGRIQRILNEVRKRRVIPFRWIVDNIRSTEKPSSWSGLGDFADTVRDAYRLDYWASLSDYVCIIVEKDTVAGRVSPITRQYDVPLHPLRGFSSTSFTYAIADEWEQIEKPITAYYIGDHDPSGREIERSMRESLARLTTRPFAWKRLAVEPEHFEKFKIIPLEAKKHDTRFDKFVRTYGRRCAEVEAIPADVLRDMVEQAILSHVPTTQWARLRKIEAQEKASWKASMGRFESGGVA